MCRRVLGPGASWSTWGVGKKGPLALSWTLSTFLSIHIMSWSLGKRENQRRIQEQRAENASSRVKPAQGWGIQVVLSPALNASTRT